MGLLRERCAELSKGLLLYCCNLIWMKNGGRIPWIVTAICETYKISCLMGRHLVRGVSENHLEDQLSLLVQWTNSTLFLVKNLSRRQESLTRFFSSAPYYRRGESGTETLWSQTLNNWRRWTHLKSMLKDSMQRKCWRPWVVKIRYSSRRWNSQTLCKRSGSENIHLNPGPPRPRRRTRKSSGRIRRRVFCTKFFGFIVVWWWSKKRCLVNFKKHFLPSSRSTQSQTARAERSVIPNSTEIHRRDQGYRCILGCNPAEKHRRLLERWWRSRIVRYVDRFHKIHDIGWKNHQMDIPGGDWQESKRHPNRTLCGQKFGKICQKRRSEENSNSGLSKNRSLTMLENCVVLTSLIHQMKNSKKFWKMRVESWKFRCQQQCLPDPGANSKGKHVTFRIIVRPNTHASLKPPNLQKSVWKDLFIRSWRSYCRDRN